MAAAGRMMAAVPALPVCLAGARLGQIFEGLFLQ
jgi:hypothetical protein